jgi:peptidyl-prolyl cis-trans isomerase C
MMLTRTLRYLSLLLALLIVAGCGSEPPSGPPPFIQINGRQLSKADFDAAFARTLQPDQPLSETERLDLQRSFLVQLIDRELIFLEARRLAVDVTPEELNAASQDYFDDYPDDNFKAMLQERGMTMASWQAELKESLIMEKLLHETVYARVVVTDEEVAAYYKEHRKEFDRPAQVRARQIVVADEAEGRRVLGLLRQGQVFADVAREHSLSPDAQQGGDLGFFGRGQMPAEFDDAVFSLPVGRLSDLVKSEYGFHIFLVEEKRAAARLSQKEADREIRRILETHKQEEAYQGWQQDLRSRAAIEVDWNQLEQ